MSNYSFEKVNLLHPDKVADRLGGFCVDLALDVDEASRIAGECILGHGSVSIIIETTLSIFDNENEVVKVNEEDLESMGRIWCSRYGREILSTPSFGQMLMFLRDDKMSWDVGQRREYFLLKIYEWIKYELRGTDKINIKIVPQDPILSKNNHFDLRCGDNGIFKGVPTNKAEQLLCNIVYYFYDKYRGDGKAIITQEDSSSIAFNLILCQSKCELNSLGVKDLLNNQSDKISVERFDINEVQMNPLGSWTGGLNVDSGAVNRKLGSDMGRAITGGGLHFKDYTKADLTLNIFCHQLANMLNEDVYCECAIGDEEIVIKTKRGYEHKFPYRDCVYFAKKYIEKIGGFEKFAEWGLLRPQNLERLY